MAEMHSPDGAGHENWSPESGDDGPSRRRWQDGLPVGHAALQGEFDRLLRGATRIRSFQDTCVPGLLQTPDYARYRALEAVRLHGTAEDRVEETVAARARRQAILYEPGRTFEFVITEAVLRYLLCPPEVMRAQLDRLLNVIGLGSITLGIIPFGRELPVAPMLGFLSADDITVIETYTSADILHGEESAKYGQVMDELAAEAATGDDARRLILTAATQLNQSK